MKGGKGNEKWTDIGLEMRLVGGFGFEVIGAWTEDMKRLIYCIPTSIKFFVFSIHFLYEDRTKINFFSFLSDKLKNAFEKDW